VHKKCQYSFGRYGGFYRFFARQEINTVDRDGEPGIVCKAKLKAAGFDAAIVKV
jgi:hypothetical protein